MRILARMSKARINLSVDESVLRDARALNVNLSQLFEQTLVERNREMRALRWQEENREAIRAYNERIERDGLWNRDLVSF
ncbi:type II toxin-antitoxin system CcdA family antitoxin [Spectribacter hydrogenooxidans]|uniref:Type II toxin-antitoxin system CcdA family antitoxin n=1 Tax=Spectribacter hydrogenoxidans TaxID=3075608 RepID=A0ABU3BZU4_9GAMM|nr:type II toxin-antitoxin system CcdA family antitoxin [Salinisphaera sp. W335]MDT0634810.1 type II toxin-antitoxin system CcdA family antitoxin [Salinisphaera sp. W335]